MTNVIFCTPTLKTPIDPYFAAIEASVPLLDAAGIEHKITFEPNDVYISHAMNTLLRRALDAKADIVVFLDYDLSWAPRDLLTLIETKGDVVAGTYLFKNEEKEEYMAAVKAGPNGKPIMRPEDNCIDAIHAPSGFLKVTRKAVNKFIEAYPQLLYGERCYPYIDLFNHGAIDWTWYGQDYGFCKRWRDMGEHVWINPFLNIDHHLLQSDGSYKAFKGNYFEWLCRQPGGVNDPMKFLQLVVNAAEAQVNTVNKAA